MAANGKDKPTRIAVVSEDRCKPKRCQQECRKSCPVVRMGRMCIEVTPTDKVAYLSEDLCIGCGICTKKCPFDAISIINIPSNLGKDTTHRYGPNSFKLHRLPSPRPASVLGLVGANGTGKTTALKILSGKLKPNLGRFEDAPDWKDIITEFRGSQLQNYFMHMLEDELKAVMKPQYVDVIPRAVQGTIGELLRRKDTLGTMAEVCEGLCLTELMDKPVVKLSGGELQRFAIAMVCVQQADIYIFDEPSSYLDVKQRLHAAKVIRNMATDGKYVIVVEHDLAVLDYLSDYVCCLYGKPGAYGVVTLPSKVREGINIFMDGYIPTENMRFRESGLVFNISQKAEERDDKRFCHYDYPEMTITMDSFHLTIHEGAFSDSEIIVMLGENGTGKTTFIRMLAGKLQADGGEAVPKLNVSYKPQKVSPKYPGTVRQLFHSKIQASYIHPQFISDVIKPMSVETLLDQKVENLSGGELQRVALTLCLGKPADVYLIDEPSAYLDSEQRLHAAKVIKRFILHAKKTAFIVEHDFIMATYLADRVVVFEGEPSIRTVANTPQTMLAGVNQFLRSLDITFRRDPHNLRPRINKLNGVRDIEQKKSGQYFFIED